MVEPAGGRPDRRHHRRQQPLRRRTVRLALALLSCLYAAAIYAPLLANDRPLFLDAVHLGEYERARKGLVPVALSLQTLVQRTEEQFLAARLAGSTLGYAAALADEREALEQRLAVLARALPPERSLTFGVALEEAERAIELARSGEHARAGEAAGKLIERVRDLRDRLDAGRIPLRRSRSFPLFEALTPLEVFFMVLGALVLLGPLWSRAVKRLLSPDRRARFAAVLGLALGSALLWELAVDGGSPFHTADFKASLASGEIRAAHVLFPPIAYGYAEQHPEEIFRPPTWTAAAELTDAGAYVRGARVPRPDPTGFVPPTTPVEIRAGEPALNSPWRHVLGTDSLGRDLLARLVHGARVSLSVGLVSTAILMGIGIAIGALAGFFGGRTDLLLSRAIEVVVSFPVLFLILVVVAFAGPSIWTVMVVIGCVGWTGVARLARGEFLRLRELDFVLAARALGFSWPRIAFRHVLPNALAPLLVAATFSVGAAILIESALSFLGLGVRVPVPSWGALASESREPAFWWIQVFPGLLIFLTVLAVNLVGDAVRDALDPRLSGSLLSPSPGRP